MTLEIKDGFYHAIPNSKAGPTKFRLAKVANSPFVILMSVDSRYPIGYTLIEKKADYYISHVFSGEDFLRYKQSVEKKAPHRWASYTAGNQWRVIDKDLVSVSSLRFLEIILPEMLAGGFHGGRGSVTAYKVMGRGVAPRVAASGTSSPEARERERLEQACKGENGAACFNLGVMFSKGEGGPQDKARARALYSQACKQGHPKGCEMETALAKLDQLDRDIERLDAELKQLCGGRVCLKTADGRTIYRTETYKSARWYFEDGRLAPRSEWPK